MKANRRKRWNILDQKGFPQRVNGGNPSQAFSNLEYYRNAMKGSGVMQGLSANQQAEILVNSIMKEIEKLNALPAEEAKRVALTNLFDAGIIDEDGNYTAPYVALGK